MLCIEYIVICFVIKNWHHKKYRVYFNQYHGIKYVCTKNKKIPFFLYKTLFVCKKSCSFFKINRTANYSHLKKLFEIK